MNREDWMRAAIQEGRQAIQENEIPVGAVVVYQHEIIAVAHNERESTCDPTAHAEVLAIRRAAKQLGRRRLHGCTLYVTLEPCAMCAGVCRASEIDAVVFGAEDQQRGCAGSVLSLCEDPALGKPVPCAGGLLQDECSALLSDFFEAHRTDLHDE